MTNSTIIRYQSAYRACFNERAPLVEEVPDGFVVHGSVCASGTLTKSDMERRISSMTRWAEERLA